MVYTRVSPNGYIVSTDTVTLLPWASVVVTSDGLRRA